jgi:ribosomal protein RSM22 (predicted rRNA methylase)
VAVRDAEGVAAYASTRAPATVAAVGAVLGHLAERWPGWAPASVLDAGAGLGVAGWAAVAQWESLAVVTSVERSAAMLAAGRSLAADAPSAAVRHGRWVAGDLVDLARGAGEGIPPADLVVAAYVLGELAEADLAGVVAGLWRATGSALVVVEPGTPTGYGRVIDVRSALVEAGARVVAPCPHDRRCPLSDVPGEWCHFARRLARSRRHRAAKGATLGWEDEKYSYVAVTRGGGAPAGGRIVRHPLQRPGLVTLQVCGEDGIRPVLVPRSRSDQWRPARDADWGDAWPPATD